MSAQVRNTARVVACAALLLRGIAGSPASATPPEPQGAAAKWAGENASACFKGVCRTLAGTGPQPMRMQPPRNAQVELRRSGQQLAVNVTTRAGLSGLYRQHTLQHLGTIVEQTTTPHGGVKLVVQFDTGVNYAQQTADNLRRLFPHQRFDVGLAKVHGEYEFARDGQLLLYTHSQLRIERVRGVGTLSGLLARLRTAVLRGKTGAEHSVYELREAGAARGPFRPQPPALDTSTAP